MVFNGDVIILRGLPAVGKSKLANDLARTYCPGVVPKEDQTTVIFSSDDYFTKDDKEYEFDKTQIQEAHKWNFERFKKAIEDKTNLIIIDNSNIKRYHFYHYVDWAQRHDYRVMIITLPHNDVSDKELAERSIHGVDRGLVSKMRREFEWKFHD